MSKIILKNPNFGVDGIYNSDKPYYVPVSKDIREYCGKYSLDLNSEIFDIYLSEEQFELFKLRAKSIYVTTFLPFKIVYETCLSLECLDVFAISPCHDMDLKEDGKTYVKPHFHLILRFKTNVSFSRVLQAFHTTEMRSIGDSWFNEYHYLYHGTEACKKAGKYLYNKNEIVSNDIAYVELRAKASKVVVTAKSILFDMRNGMSVSNLIDKYDFLFVHNVRNLYFIYDRIMSEERKIERDVVSNVYDLGDSILLKFKNGSTELVSKCHFERFNNNESE